MSHHRHHYHSPWRRAAYSVGLVVAVMVIGTLGMHYLDGMSYLDAFYFMSMVATAQGPSRPPETPAGKIFAAVMAFISIGAMVTALGFLFGPFFGKLWHVGVEKFEEEIHVIESRHHKPGSGPGAGPAPPKP